MLQELHRVTLGTIKAYQCKRFIPQLRAFVDFGNGYELGEIVNASQKDQRASVRILGDEMPCWYPYSALHCVHTYHPHTNTVEIHGDIPCNK